MQAFDILLGFNSLIAAIGIIGLIRDGRAIKRQGGGEV